MTPLDQFLKEAREKREAAIKGPYQTEGGMDLYVFTEGNRDMIAEMRGVGSDLSYKEMASNAKFFVNACNNQERFEQLVRVAVEKFQLIKEGARFTDPKTTNNNGIAMLSAMQIEQLASDALIQMNEIAGEK